MFLSKVGRGDSGALPDEVSSSQEKSFFSCEYTSFTRVRVCARRWANFCTNCTNSAWIFIFDFHAAQLCQMEGGAYVYVGIVHAVYIAHRPADSICGTLSGCAGHEGFHALSGGTDEH